MTKCDIDINPFYFGKIEHELGPTLYVPDRIIEWASSKPIFFEGVRGSGKSSALKLLSWDVAWEVAPVKISGSYKVNRFFKSPKHIGLYYRVEDTDAPLWDRWNVNEDTAQRYFGTYIEYIYIDLLLDALIEIRKKTRKLFVDREAEKMITAQLIKNSFPSSDKRPRLHSLSFSSLRDFISDIHVGIRNLVFQDASEETIKATFNVVGPGSLLRVFGDAFQRMYPEINDWVILLLLDDANFLKEWQAKVINTMVASCRIPLSYKISYLANLYPTLDTMDKNRPLGLDYIEVVQMPTHNAPFLPKNFRTKFGMKYLTFVNNVCKARIGEFFDEEIARKFDFKTYLGTFNIEDLLMKRLKDSEKDKALELIKKARKSNNGKISITGTWLEEKKIRDIKIDDDLTIEKKKFRKRQIASSYLKKWNHVAAISICKEFGLDFPYSTEKVIQHLSQGSIRELLRIMSRIWEVNDRNIEKFLKKIPIPRELQTKGIQAAAENRFQLIGSKPRYKSHVSLQNVCERLGKLFSKLQSYPYITT